MALGLERTKCELSLENNNSPLFPQKKMEDVPASQCRDHEDPAVVQQDGHLQIMYCKDLLYQDDNEFSFEELRAQRYYKALSEKASHLNKLKQDLQLQIEQKQKLLQQKNTTAPQQVVGEETVPDGTCESISTGIQSAPIKIHSNIVSSMGSEENMTDGGSDSKLQKMTTSKPFTVFEDNPQSNKIPCSTKRRSLKLPTLNLKAPRSKAELSADREASLSRSEEPIINGHWNKTLCRSPNDTCEFARAAQFASTPFAGAERQKLTEDLNTAAPEASQTQDTDARKLSPIQEISHDWGGTSVTVTHESIKPSHHADIIQEEDEVLEIQPENNCHISQCPHTAAAGVQTQDVCSQEVRSRLLEQVDLTSFSNFHRQTGALPQASGHDDLLLDGEMLFYCSKLGKLKDYTLYSSSTGSVLLKVDSSSVPWDFFISSKITSSLSTRDDDVHASCYLYDNGCLTLWRIPHGVTIEDLLAEPVARADLPHLVIRLLEMVKRLHSCQIVHGGLKPETVYFCRRLTVDNSDITALDFSASVDLQLQTDVRTVQVLSSAQDYITQGLLTPSASLYQVDLMGVAEVVHMLVLNRPLKVSCGSSGWSLDEHHSSSVDPVWKEFFQMILNPGELSTELILSSLIRNLKESL